jgi:NAD(P)-dependent dehydrogenase (short-subunit alcohol dehydrogenase family)
MEGTLSVGAAGQKDTDRAARILLLADFDPPPGGDTMTELSGKTALVVGGSRGFGRGIADALLAAGATVHVVARNPQPLAEFEHAGRGRARTTAADAADPEVSGKLLDEAKPNIVILNAGATPQLEPIHRQTWESFSINWNSDVKIAFHWLRQILLTPLPPGSQVVVTSSGAALRGSPLSGGYAGAKATIRFIAQYAAEESRRAKLGIRVTAMLPQLTPTTELGRAAVAAYARRSGRTEEQFLAQMGPPLTPPLVGAAVIRLLTDPSLDANAAFSLDASGLTPL